MMRRTAALGLLCAVLAAAADAGSAPSPPNIIFIMSDDHRWDGLGAAGNPHVITPNLDPHETRNLAGDTTLARTERVANQARSVDEANRRCLPGQGEAAMIEMMHRPAFGRNS